MKRKIFFRISLLLFLLLGLLVAVFSNARVQTRLGAYVSEKLKRDFNVEIQISKIDFSYLGRVRLEHIYLADHHQDTLIAAQSLHTTLTGFFNIFSKNITLGYTYLENATLHLKRYKGEHQNNMMFFVEKFPTDTVVSDTPFVVKASLIDVVNGNVIVENENEPPENIVFYKNIHASVLDFESINERVRGKVRNAKAVDHFGFHYTDVHTDYSYSNSKMRGLNAKVKTQNSSLQADVFLDYTWEALDYFTDQVQIKIDLKKSEISLLDLSHFYPDLKAPELLKISANIAGTCNDFNVKNLQAQAIEKPFVLRGNYTVRNSFKTWEDFIVKGNNQNLNTSTSALKTIFPEVLGKYLPKELMDFGTIQTKNQASFTFSPAQIKSSFIAKTNMGEIGSHIVLKNFQNRDSISYNGQLYLKNFDLGKFVKDKNIGKLSLSAHAQGTGLSKKSLHTSLKGIVKKHQYKNYSYKNIRLMGCLEMVFLTEGFPCETLISKWISKGW